MKTFEKIYTPLRDKRRDSVLIFFIFLIGIGSLQAQQVRLQPTPNAYLGLTQISASDFSLQDISTNVLVGSRSINNNWVTGRGYLHFNLSDIPQGATITNARLQLQANAQASNFNGNFTLRRADFVLAHTDVTAWGFLRTGPGQDISHLNFSNGGGYSIPIPSSHIQNRLAPGFIAFSMVHRAESPTSTAFMSFNMSQNFAFLEVTYTLPVTAAPGVPTNLSANNITATGCVLTWTRPAGTVTGYRIYRNGTFLQSVPATATTAIISNLSAFTTYRFSISAVNSAGASARSQEITVQTLHPVPVISGQSLICSASTFAITNLQPGAVATWTHSPNLQVSSSGNTATVWVNAPFIEGSWVQATVNGVPSNRHTFWAGTPFISKIVLNNSSGNIGSFEAILPMAQLHTTNWNGFRWWLDIDPWAYNFINGANGPIVDIEFNTGGFFMLWVTATNACGEGTSQYAMIYYFGYVGQWGSRHSAHTQPQPISGAFHVLFGDDPNAREQHTYNVRIYNSAGSRMRQEIAASGRAEFDLSNLPAGNYYLHICNGVDEPVVQPIVVGNRDLSS
jgi:hypothetical protein